MGYDMHITERRDKRRVVKVKAGFICGGEKHNWKTVGVRILKVIWKL